MRAGLDLATLQRSPHLLCHSWLQRMFSLLARDVVCESIAGRRVDETSSGSAKNLAGMPGNTVQSQLSEAVAEM